MAGAVVFRGALSYFFAQDDFAGLARAAGILPRLDGLWRYVSGQLYFDVMRSVAGLDAFAYHLASLLAHLVCSVLLYTLMARRLSRAAAFTGAIFFAVHPAFFTALYSVSGIGEILSLLFALGALWAILLPGRWNWTAAPLFALSLLSKESTLLLPLATALGFAVPAGERPRRRLLLPLGIIAAAYAVDYLRSDVFSVGAGLSKEAAYALGEPGDIGRNLLTYLGWTSNLFLPTVRGFGDAVDPMVFPWGIALAGLWLIGLLSRRLRERGWMAAGAVYLLFLLPVLPLRNHTYHYYLYAPMIGAAWLAAAAFDALAMPALARKGWTVGGAALLAGGLTLNGALLVHKNETMPFVVADLRSDPTVDRAVIARNVYEGLERGALPEGATLWLWSPALAAARSDRVRLAAERVWTNNVQTALLDGVGVRVLFPQVKEVRFVEALPPMPPTDPVAVYRRDGRLRVSSRAELDSVLRLHPPEAADGVTGP